MRTLLLRAGFATLTGIVVIALSMAWSDRTEAGGTPQAAAAALDIDSGKIQSVSFNGSDLRGIAVQTGPLGNPSFPTEGDTFLILSTGIAADAKLPDDSGSHSTELDGLNNSQGHDMVQLDLTLEAPLDATCMRFDWAFFSEEFPEFVGTEFNDGFVVQIGAKSFSIVGNQIVVSPSDSNIARDPVDSSVMDVSSAVAFHGGTGTTYDGATDLLTASVPVISGEKIQVVFYIQDLGDSLWDSAVFLDNLRWTQETGAACPATIQAPQAVFTDWVPGPLSAARRSFVRDRSCSGFATRTTRTPRSSCDSSTLGSIRTSSLERGAPPLPTRSRSRSAESSAWLMASKSARSRSIPCSSIPAGVSSIRIQGFRYLERRWRCRWSSLLASLGLWRSTRC